MKQLYEAIRDRRIELGMSQDALARAVGYTNRSTISKLEKGDIEISVPVFLRLSEVLKLSAKDLLNQVEEDAAEVEGLYINKLTKEQEHILEEIGCLSDENKKLLRDFIELLINNQN